MLEGLKTRPLAGKLLHADFGDKLVPYKLSLELQQALRTIIGRGQAADILLQLQHPPSITVGKRGQDKDFLVPEETLQKNGIDIHRVPRGGETTVHGPGQLISYPVVNLRRIRRGARAYVEGLEDSIIKTLGKYGVQAEGRQPVGRTGVWVEDRKIAALGVQISGGIATHGSALNISTDLELYKYIIPCGLPDSPVTTLEEETKAAVYLNEASQHLSNSFVDIFGYDTVIGIQPKTLLQGLHNPQKLLAYLESTQEES